MKIIAAISTALLALTNISRPVEPSYVVEGLENAPIVYEDSVNHLKITGETLAFDTLRVIVEWSHIADSAGVEDSTFFRIKANKTIKFMGGGTNSPNVFRRRSFKQAALADTFKVLRPAFGDSVIFVADSISQCRTNLCSQPGGAGWGYRRTLRPPSMSFTKMTTDSF